jgi:predicted enzyme related to lactoylglutathione lyase
MEAAFPIEPSRAPGTRAIIATNIGKGARLVKRIAKIVMGAGAAWMLASAAQAGAQLYAGRVGAEDVAATAKFYQTVFGLQEVNRISLPGGQIEIMLNSGDTVAAAKANANAQVVIMHRDSNALKDSVPHLIFTVTDVAATAKAVKAAGGSMNADPRAFGNSGMIVGFAADPAGNLVELFQLPKK